MQADSVEDLGDDGVSPVSDAQWGAAGDAQWQDGVTDGVEDSTWGLASDAAEGDESAWGGSSSWDAGEGNALGDGAPAADWLSAAAPAPKRRSRPIETVKVGIIQTPYKRRNGYHAEVAVQHAGAEESIHRLWFGFEVLDDVATLRGGDRYDMDVERFCEAVVGYLQQQGVDLADPDWGMQDDSIPFSTQHLPMRTLLDYYPDLSEVLVAAAMKDIQPEEVELPPMAGSDFEVPLVLDRPFIDKGDPLASSREALQAAVDRGFQKEPPIASASDGSEA
eukprot:CAMPEP_0115858606 /NCGR_PEP_ID=MMETSP0287-20121206/16186_1 /TAXON_ID=412157 /ORGANISM="Chrysochromulina rotalis, Strain UIO044" /LENGTH=277 /DNA_ID=CAMNT_0003312879 /DNA_START=75 /DNA_END=908 /DNA_ORIENTATION=+